jgi:c-di-GMP-binding flagellar brake protein YcgR
MQTRLSHRLKVSLEGVSKIDKRSKKQFALTKGDSFKIDILDISVLGLCMISKYFLPKGLFVDLEIDGTLFGLKETMKIKGEIRYCEYLKYYTYRCGVKFLDMPEKYKKVISRFIAAYERRKNPRLKLSK